MQGSCVRGSWILHEFAQQCNAVLAPALLSLLGARGALACRSLLPGCAEMSSSPPVLFLASGFWRHALRGQHVDGRLAGVHWQLHTPDLGLAWAGGSAFLVQAVAAQVLLLCTCPRTLTMVVPGDEFLRHWRSCAFTSKSSDPVRLMHDGYKWVLEKDADANGHSGQPC